jgi:hypothetical protein
LELTILVGSNTIGPLNFELEFHMCASLFNKLLQSAKRYRADQILNMAACQCLEINVWMVRPPGFGPGCPCCSRGNFEAWGAPVIDQAVLPPRFRVVTGPRPSGVLVSHSQRPATTTATTRRHGLRIKISPQAQPTATSMPLIGTGFEVSPLKIYRGLQSAAVCLQDQPLPGVLSEEGQK